MTQYNIRPSYSTPQGLAVFLAVPAPVITGVNWPSSPKVKGASCKTDVSYRNDGGDGDIFLRIINSLGTVLASSILSAAAGETGTLSLYFNMPASDIIIYAQSGVDSTVTDTSDSYSLEVLLTIETSLTLSLPASVEVGASVAFSGRLTREDAQPTGIQTIKVIDDVSGTLKATVQTSTNGNYSGTFTAPSTKGTYYYAAEFGGAALAVYGLGPSSSKPKGLAVGVEVVNYVPYIIAGLMIGVAVLAVLKYRS